LAASGPLFARLLKMTAIPTARNFISLLDHSPRWWRRANFVTDSNPLEVSVALHISHTEIASLFILGVAR
jgi:hypothetical protein